MVLTDERPAHPGGEPPLVPQEDRAGHGAELHPGVGLHAHHDFRAERGATGLRALLEYPVMDERAELVIIKKRAEPGKKAQPDVLQPGFHAVRQDQLSGRGDFRLPVIVEGDILPPKVW